MITTISFIALCLTMVGGEHSGEPHHHAMCDIDVSTGSDMEHIHGMVLLEQHGEGMVTLKLDLKGFNTDDGIMYHGFHIHTDGDMSDACRGAGGHFNPHSADHGAINDTNRHVGDLGNIMETDGVVQTTIVDESGLIQLDPDHEHTVIGRAIVVHERRDDLGQGGESSSMTTGNAGSRMACCLIKVPEAEGDTDSAAPRTNMIYMSALLLSLVTAVLAKMIM